MASGPLTETQAIPTNPPSTSQTNQPTLMSRIIARFRSSPTTNPTRRPRQSHLHIQPATGVGSPSLSAALWTQANQIAAAFPAVPLDAILADLAQTRVAEVTVENILAGHLDTDAAWRAGVVEEVSSPAVEENVSEDGSVSAFDFDEDSVYSTPQAERRTASENYGLRHRVNASSHSNLAAVMQVGTMLLSSWSSHSNAKKHRLNGAYFHTDCDPLNQGSVLCNAIHPCILILCVTTRLSFLPGLRDFQTCCYIFFLKIKTFSLSTGIG